MKSEPQNSPEEIERVAAEWIIRLDRGLGAAEQDEYSRWLASDARHREAIQRMRWGWEELDRLAGLEASELATPDPDLLAPKRRMPRRSKFVWLAPVTLALAAAAAIAVLVQLRRADRDRATPQTVLASQTPESGAASYECRLLEDGSTIELNRGASVSVEFTPAERHVRLLRGEANFTVAKNPSRPFTVSAGGVTVQAVGTIFNVRLESASVDVLVSEGTVKVGQRLTEHAEPSAAEPFFIKAGQHALVPLSTRAAPSQVNELNATELAERLAWQTKLLDFNATPLAEVVSAFNAHNRVKLVIGDAALRATPISATIRWDNVDGFVRLMDSEFGVRAETRGDHEIVLFKK